jgi:3-methyladenine DNA glycosylase AlkD
MLVEGIFSGGNGMVHDYVNKLVDWMSVHRNEENAEPMKKYMRNQFEFLGIKTPQRTALLREFLKEHGKPHLEDLSETVLGLWELPEREFQYIALALLEKDVKKLTESHVKLAEKLIVTKSWWDTVDHLATRIVGTILKKHPVLIKPFTGTWIQSDNFWLQRTAILFQLKYKKDTDEALLYRYIRMCKDSKEFFIQKAIGWALREYSKTNPESVKRFVESEELAPLSKREALKVIKKATESH